MNEEEQAAYAVAKAIREAIKEVQRKYPESQIRFDGVIEVDGIPFYKPDWMREDDPRNP